MSEKQKLKLSALYKDKSLEEIHGKQKATEIKKKLSISLSGKKKTNTEDYSLSAKARVKAGTHHNQIKIACPHCGKSGGRTNMKRYHFDNCKHKKL